MPRVRSPSQLMEGTLWKIMFQIFQLFLSAISNLAAALQVFPCCCHYFSNYFQKASLSIKRCTVLNEYGPLQPNKLTPF